MSQVIHPPQPPVDTVTTVTTQTATTTPVIGVRPGTDVKATNDRLADLGLPPMHQIRVRCYQHLVTENGIAQRGSGRWAEVVSDPITGAEGARMALESHVRSRSALSGGAQVGQRLLLGQTLRDEWVTVVKTGGGSSTSDPLRVATGAVETVQEPAPPNLHTNPAQVGSGGTATPVATSTARPSTTVRNVTPPPEPPPETVTTIEVDRILLIPGYVAPGRTIRGVTFQRGNDRYLQTSDAQISKNVDPQTGIGQTVGDVDLATGLVTLHDWDSGENLIVKHWSGLQMRPTAGVNEIPLGCSIIGRTAAAPLRPESFQLVCRMGDGQEVIVSGDANGHIIHSRVVGSIDYDKGVFSLIFISPAESGYGSVDLSSFQVPGVGVVFLDRVIQSTLRYNAVAYEFIPVDPAIIGVDPVRLPSDGRVPIFAVGDYVVVHNWQSLPTRQAGDPSLLEGDVISVGRKRLSRIILTGADGKEITTGWAADLDEGTFEVVDSSNWLQPVQVAHTVEHMARVRDVDISGNIDLTLRLPHNFPVEGSYISSALMLGNRFARVSHVWDQHTWTNNLWLDHIEGNPAVASYNDGLSPIEVDNAGAVTQRWVIRFRNTTDFELIGQHVGVVAAGTINEDFEPVNPLGGNYMIVRALGWGVGWAAGNVVRINTVAAGAAFNVIRPVQPGEYTALDHRFSLLVRVDADRPGLGD